MTRPKIKKYRYFISLSQAEEQLLRSLMEQGYKTKGEESSFFAGLLVARQECRQEHSKSKAGRPRNDESDSPEASPLPVDDLSFTPEQLAEVKRKTEANKRS